MRGGVVLQRAVDEQVRLALAHERGRLASPCRRPRRTRTCPVLKLIIATRGSMPNARADAALCIAMSASCVGVGIGVHRAVAVDHDLVGQAHEEDRRHQRRPPARCPAAAGRGAAWRRCVCTAPATRPSTSSRRSIIVPSVIGSASWSRAMSGGHALVLAGLDHRVDVALVDHRRVDDLEVGGQRQAEPDGLGRDLSRAAPAIRSARCRAAWQIVAARSVRGSAPSGSTMRSRPRAGQRS